MQAVAIYRTTVGKKAIMAVTGAIWIGYVVLHMYGNLKAFYGPEVYNAYAEGLRTFGGPILGHLQFLYIARIVFLVSIVLHVWAATRLYQRAYAARPTTYATRRVVQADYAARTMRVGGLLIAIFLLLHVAQLTWGVQALNDNSFVQGDPYHNLLNAFRSPFISGLYLAAMLVLGFHLFHGAWSMFQTLGLNSRRLDKYILVLAWFIAIIVPVGFALVPIAIQLGIVQ